MRERYQKANDAPIDVNLIEKDEKYRKIDLAAKSVLLYNNIREIERTKKNREEGNNMREEILPIGTICELAENKKVMITGYKRKVFSDGLLQEKDYETIEYPYGTLSNIRRGINKDEIKKVIYRGYSDYEFTRFEQQYNGEAPQVATAAAPVPVANPFSIKEETAKSAAEEETWPIFKNIEFDENGIVTSAEQNEAPQEPDLSNIMPKYEFDENGVITGIEEQKEETPKYEAEPVSKYKFDENGVIIGTSETKTEETPQTEPSYESTKYQFDENGVITGIEEQKEDAPKYAAETVSKYKYDENGVIIGVEEETITAETPTETLEENKVPKYKFDENGIIIGVE